MREGATQAEIHEAEVSDRCPRQREHTKPVRTEAANEPRNRDERGDERHGLPREIQRSVPREQP
jgi:hypothetical protein